MPSRAITLIKSIGIYAVGNIASRLVMFLLIPVYSFFVSADDIGYYDVCFAAVMLLLPFIQMQMREGVFRFLVDDNSSTDRTRIITFVTAELIRNSIISLVLSAGICLFWDIRFIWLTALFAITISIFEVMVQAIRGLGHTKTFVAVGILSSISIAAITLVLTLCFGLGIESLFWGNIFGRIIALAFGEARIGMLREYVRFSADWKSIGSDIRKYCLPIIVTVTTMWMINYSNRFFINHILGEYSNGQFAIAQKFASIIETLAVIFCQAWQEMAIKQYSSADRNEFYSHVANTYIWVLSVLVVGMAFGARFAYPFIVGPELQESAQYLMLLMVVTMILVLCNFYDIGYQCAKDTKRAINSVVVGIFITLAGNYFLPQLFGIYGIIITLLASYSTIICIRVIETRRYFRITIQPRTFLSMGIVAAACVAFHLPLSPTLQAVALAVIAALLLATTPQELRDLTHKILHRS